MTRSDLRGKEESLRGKELNNDQLKRASVVIDLIRRRKRVEVAIHLIRSSICTSLLKTDRALDCDAKTPDPILTSICGIVLRHTF